MMAYTNTINDTTPMAEYAEAFPVYDQTNEATLQEQQQFYACDYPTSYLISNNWFGGGNADITCQTNNNEVMFQMVRMGGSVLRRNNIMSINNMAGQPVLSMREHKYGSGTAMELCRYDPSAPDTPVPFCRVVRKLCKMTIHNRYEVQLIGAYNTGINQQVVECNGHWPKKFTFEGCAKHGTKEMASVQKTNFKKWKLNVSAGEDVLLFLGIACAIDRISHEAKQRKATWFAVGAAVDSAVKAH